MRAVSAEDALAYDEPPAWYYPVRESLGGACLRAGKPVLAEAGLREGPGAQSRERPLAVRPRGGAEGCRRRTPKRRR